MARRKGKPSQYEQAPEPCARQAARLPQQWSDIDVAELQRRHQQAALLVARGYGAVRLEGDRSHGEPF